MDKRNKAFAALTEYQDCECSKCNSEFQVRFDSTPFPWGTDGFPCPYCGNFILLE